MAASITKTYVLPLGMDRVQDILTDLSLYAQYHHLIRGADKIRESPAGHPVFKIGETPFSWFPMKIYYDVEVVSEGGRITYLVSGIPLSKPTISYGLTSLAAEGTQVEFKLEIKGFFLSNWFVKTKMVHAQNKLMGRLGHKPSR